jgi:DNA relaxase NicK
VDSCEDYHHLDAYDYLREIGLRIAKECKIKVREITKPDPQSDDGRTLYLGSPTSDISARIYEKGKQLGVDSEWVRAELQVRPQKKIKHFAACLDAQELWGLARWSRLMVAELGIANIKRVDAQVYQPSDDQRSYGWLLRQYGNLLKSMHGTHGSWEAVGAQIGYDLEHKEERQQKAVLRPSKTSGVSEK